uniref:Uncharacterized protein MANES_01G037600 n=1 Tax=Rhizophora mucronata TaxID=61149 RepID=A0A2P2KRB5_RHIMU
MVMQFHYRDIVSSRQYCVTFYWDGLTKAAGCDLKLVK